MVKDSKECTTFRTKDGLFQFRSMPLGLTNAPATFKQIADAVFASLKGVNLQISTDDMCVANDTWSEHCNHRAERLRIKAAARQVTARFNKNLVQNPFSFISSLFSTHPDSRKFSSGRI